MQWETLDDMRKRMRRAADKYTKYNKVILVGHGMSLKNSNLHQTNETS